jgi:uncharacterized protein with PIN domain
MRFPPLRVLSLLPALIVASLAGCHKPKPPPSINALTDALERSAEKDLPAPSLANEQIILPARPGHIGAQAVDVLKAATAAGGVAISSTDAQARVSILATVPENNADAFKAALRHEQAPMQSPASATTLIEVLIENATPSPTP